MKFHWRMIAGTILLTFSALGADVATAEQFLAAARAARGGASYAKLDGTVRHRRKNAKNQEEAFYFGILITPERMLAQLRIGRSESYTVGQTFLDGGATSVVPAGEYKNPRLGEFGIRASDLTLGFLQYRLVRELEPVTVRLVPCRVLLLASPDGREEARVAIAAEYRMPLRAEFFRPGEPEPFRTLEIASFKKKDDLYYTDVLDLFGPGWRTRIEFSAAEVGIPPPGNPPSIFKPVEKQP